MGVVVKLGPLSSFAPRTKRESQAKRGNVQASRTFAERMATKVDGIVWELTVARVVFRRPKR